MITAWEVGIWGTSARVFNSGVLSTHPRTPHPSRPITASPHHLHFQVMATNIDLHVQLFTPFAPSLAAGLKGADDCPARTMYACMCKSPPFCNLKKNLNISNELLNSLQ